MKLNHLVCFYTINRTGSFRKAAVSLGISQASVTLAIQNLEEELGIKLFDRSGRQVKLTKAGRIALKRVDNILREVHELEHLGNHLQEGTGKIRLAFGYCGDLCVWIANEFSLRHPDIYVDIQQRNIQRIIPLLENDEYDIGITYTDFVTDDQYSIPFVDLEFGVFFPTNHPFEVFEVIKARQLESQKLLFPTLETKTELRIRNYLSENNVSPDIRKTVYAMDPQIASILVEYSNEVAILPLELRENMQGVSARKLDPPFKVEQSAVWSKSKYVNESMDTMIEFLKHVKNK